MCKVRGSFHNDSATGTIVKDPVHFPLVRRLYDLMLTGSYSPREIAVIARDEWGFRTPKTKRLGDKPLAMGSVYRILTNPFYAGIIAWGKETFIGKHEPLCTLDEQERIRALLAKPGTPRPKAYTFDFIGLMRCGTCQLGITAEHKTNKYGSRYIYYHCTKSRMPPRCKEPSIEARALEQQVLQFLDQVTIPKPVAYAIERELIDLSQDDQALRAAKTAELDRALAGVVRQQSELTGIRIRGLISDDEYVSRRATLLLEHQALLQRRAGGDGDAVRIELFQMFISFRKCATKWYVHADAPTKRMILRVAASNFVLSAKMLSIQARKPFVPVGDIAPLVSERRW